LGFRRTTKKRLLPSCTSIDKFCAPIKEEHAWALIFSGLKKLVDLHRLDIKCHLMTGVEDLILGDDGDYLGFRRTTKTRL